MGNYNFKIYMIYRNACVKKLIKIVYKQLIRSIYVARTLKKCLRIRVRSSKKTMQFGVSDMSVAAMLESLINIEYDSVHELHNIFDFLENMILPLSQFIWISLTLCEVCERKTDF